MLLSSYKQNICHTFLLIKKGKSRRYCRIEGILLFVIGSWKLFCCRVVRGDSESSLTTKTEHFVKIVTSFAHCYCRKFYLGYLTGFLMRLQLCLTITNLLSSIGFICVAAAFKKGIDEFVCKLSLSRTFLKYFSFPISSLSSFLCIPPKYYCITRMFFNEQFTFSSLDLLHQSLHNFHKAEKPFHDFIRVRSR